MAFSKIIPTMDGLYRQRNLESQETIERVLNPMTTITFKVPTRTSRIQYVRYLITLFFFGIHNFERSAE